MRTLSKFERKVVKKLCEKHQIFGDLFEKDFLQDLIIELTNDTINEKYEIKFLIKKEVLDSDELFWEKMREVTERIVQTINLLNYLKSQAYIFSFKVAHGFSVHGLIGLKEVVKDYQDNSAKYIETPYPDIKTYNFIFEYVDNVFASTEALKDYIKKGFRTKEQVRHRQILYVAWTAIFVTALIGLIGFFCN